MEWGPRLLLVSPTLATPVSSGVLSRGAQTVVASYNRAGAHARPFAGGISGSLLEPLGRYQSHFDGGSTDRGVGAEGARHAHKARPLGAHLRRHLFCLPQAVPKSLC